MHPCLQFPKPASPQTPETITTHSHLDDEVWVVSPISGLPITPILFSPGYYDRLFTDIFFPPLLWLLLHMGYSTMLPGSHVITALSSSKIFNSSLLLTKTNPNCLACSSDPLIDHKPHFQPYIYYLHLSSSHSTPGNNPGKSSVHASHDDFSAETLCLFKAALRCHPL